MLHRTGSQLLHFHRALLPACGTSSSYYPHKLYPERSSASIIRVWARHRRLRAEPARLAGLSWTL
jgi:hypothetical protein